MIVNYLDSIFKAFLWISLFVVACTFYTYIVNAHRAADHPKKREYYPLAILIAPFTLPFLISFALVVFIIEAVLFGTFLVVFTVALLDFRQPFLLGFLHKVAMKGGEPLLKFNTAILKLMFTSWNKSFPAA